MNETVRGFAAAAFGLEGLVASELKSLGLKDAKAGIGGVTFPATWEELFLCNLRLRCADRVYVILGEERVSSFEDLFQLVSGIPWEKVTAGNEAFNVSANCVRSRLMSPRDCQAITKKAIIERLRRRRGQGCFPEDGAPFPVQVSIREDVCRVMLNTSGSSLSRRGYRTWNGEAPLRETLAAALIRLSPWRPALPLHDPCCGTGTLLIEAAFRAAHRAPGLTRSFAMEQFSFVNRPRLEKLRREEEKQYEPERIGRISGTDIDPEALELAGRHVRQAGLEGKILLERQSLQELRLEEPEGVFICNPPYGERLGDQEACRKLYRDLKALKDRHPGWSLCAISSDPAFERSYGRRADRKRRLYNGRLECTYYIYQ